MRLRVLAAAVGVILSVGAAVLLYEAFTPTEAVRTASVVVDVPAHEGPLEIARRFENAGVVRSEWTFLALSAVRGTIRKLKAGEYEVPRGATPLAALRLVERGRVRQHPVLHPEGATVAELARALEAAGLARSEDVLRIATDPSFLRAHGIPEAPSIEGYLFPDTYYFVKGMRTEELLGRMVQRLRAKLGTDIEARARARGFTVHQLLTLASIIEREAVAPEEAKIISGVFWNRLRRDMPLQADPTVQYAVRKERGTLTRSDLATDHPYNTYRRTGLPPGPIASPGLRSIDATLDPAQVSYLYFVAVDERRHHFSTTVAEHNEAVARYRKMRANSR
jgi:UPF0755 protein